MPVIVVGVDSSLTALRAAETARANALALQARLHVVTAFDSDRTEVFGSGSDKRIVTDADSAELIAREVAKQLEAPGLSVTYSAARGKPAEALIQEAERQEAQLIVVGNLRMRGVGRVLGSIANSVAHNAPCDVLIVKTDEPRPKATQLPPSGPAEQAVLLRKAGSTPADQIGHPGLQGTPADDKTGAKKPVPSFHLSGAA